MYFLHWVASVINVGWDREDGLVLDEVATYDIYITNTHTDLHVCQMHLLSRDLLVQFTSVHYMYLYVYMYQVTHIDTSALSN